MSKAKAIRFLDSLVSDTTTKADLDTIAFIKRCVKDFREEPKEEKPNFEDYISELFDKFYKIYCRKGARQQAFKSFRKKLIKLKTQEEILEKARKIAKLYARQREELENRDMQYRPLCSSWLNSNIPD